MSLFATQPLLDAYKLVNAKCIEVIGDGDRNSWLFVHAIRKQLALRIANTIGAVSPLGWIS